MDPDELLTTAQAARLARVRPSAITNWRERGHLCVARDAEGKEIRDARGRPYYRLIDVARAELATRRRARRVYPSQAGA